MVEDKSLPAAILVRAKLQQLLGEFSDEFNRIKMKRFKDTEEVRYDIPVDVANSDIYTGVAADGTLTSSASWTIIRTYFDANGNPTRERFRTGVAWDDRTSGWS